MNNIALDLGFVQIYWYSIMVLLGIFFASVVIFTETRRQNINEDFMVNLIFYGIILGLIGARLYYVLFNLNYYMNNPIEILEVWNGGLAIHGGILFGFLFILFFTWKHKVSTLKVLDIIAVGLLIGQCVGRWGNFFNGEAFGPATTLEVLQAWHLPEFIINGMNINGVYHVPTFLMESVWTFICFIVMLFVRRYKYLKTGVLTGLYFILYSLGRFFIEFLRTDSLYLGSIRIAQLVSVVLFIVGIIIVVVCSKRGSKLENLYLTREEKTEY